MKKLLTIIAVAALTLSAQAQAPAFPGAEGHGRFATGGRGGKIVHVTNLNDSGTGSLRAAVSNSDKKIVVFDVGGVIALTRDLTIGANTTILGQTTPAPGITLRYYTVQPSSNCVIRFIRCRRGQEKDVNDGADAIWQRHITGTILDHCSFSWSIDEVASFYDNNNFTLQWCTIGESLNNAGHGKGAHGYGGIWGGKLASFHHNLICHVGNRSPRFNGARYDWTGYTSNQRYSEFKWENAVQAENVDFRNCVIYNCGNGCYGGPGGGKINMVGNFYKTGPAATTNRLTTCTVGSSDNASGYPIYHTMTSRYYLNDNKINNTAAGWSYMSYDDGTYLINNKRYSPDPNHYNGENETYVKNTAGVDCICMQLDQPTETGVITTHPASKAFSKVITYAGASFIRDNVDTRYATEANDGTATYSGSVTKKPGRIDLVADVNGYTEENFGTGSRQTGFDSDNDGIPDKWETANGLNPNDKNDAQLYTLDPKKYYTNIEVYANSLVQDIMLDENKDANNDVKEYYPAYKKEDGTQVEAINGSDDVDPMAEAISGNITWSLSEGNATPGHTFSSAIGDYLETVEMTVPSHLTIGGTKNVGFDMTAFTITDNTSDADANSTNGVKFSIKPKNGYLFQPTQVSFNATRFGTDHGRFMSYWLYDDETSVSIASDQLAQRDNATPKYSTVDEVLTAKATTGESSLVIHLYDIPYNTNTKYMGLANVVISGKVGSTSSGINQLSTTSSQKEYYSLQGIRVNNPDKGVFICVERMANGQSKSSKIIIK